MAERVGFEPTSGDEPTTRFRVVRDQPDSATSPHGLRSAVVCRYLTLSVVKMAPPARFERATRNLGGCCSIQLSYGGTGLGGEMRESRMSNLAVFLSLSAVVCLYLPLSAPICCCLPSNGALGAI